MCVMTVVQAGVALRPTRWSRLFFPDGTGDGQNVCCFATGKVGRLAVTVCGRVGNSPAKVIAATQGMTGAVRWCLPTRCWIKPAH